MNNATTASQTPPLVSVPLHPIVRPLFLPLKHEYFEAFERGEKTVEYRVYGTRWNERTCAVGRKVVLSHGYGTKRRLRGEVTHFEKSREPLKTLAWLKCYGHRTGDCACITIKLDRSNAPLELQAERKEKL